MPEWYDGYVSANGVRLHYSRTGGDLPPLVLSHGVTDQGLCWGLAARALRDQYDVIMPDARGHGLSEAPASGDYSLDAQADDLAGLIAALGLVKPCLGGHSMGAVTSLFMAAYHPEVPRCLFLEDGPFPYLLDAPLEQREQVAREFRQSDEGRRAKTRQELVAWCHEACPTWADEEIEFWADSAAHVRIDFRSLLVVPTRLPWREAMARVQCPVLVLVPEHGMTTEEQAAEFVSLLPRGEAATIAGTGHCIRRDNPDEYLSVVREFMRRSTD